MEKIKIKIKKYYKILSPTFSIFIGGAGLALSIIGLNFKDSNKLVFSVVLILAELFLVLSVLYTSSLFINSVIEEKTLFSKEQEIHNNQKAIKIISENNRSIVTTYKDFEDKLEIVKKHYLETESQLKKHYLTHQSCPNKEETTLFVKNTREQERIRLKQELISNYNRLLASVTNLLRQSIEQYFVSKGLNTSVSIAIKQLEVPIHFSDIEGSKVNVYTAFRDAKSYNKKRKETWEKAFKIRKNSDFILSIQKGYYIFNNMSKKYLEDGLYQNENETFYEDYNSGITCTIHSCVNGDRILFGYLACDSLIDIFNKHTEYYDWNVANIMMLSANLIASYLGKFLIIWDEIYVNWESDLEKWSQNNHSSIVFSHPFDVDNINKNNPQNNKYNFCKEMKKSVEKTRYNNS